MVGNFNINLLPGEIISDILSRLPTKSVLESKLVCKSWKNLIHRPSFAQMHLTRLNHNPDSTDSGKLSYIFSNIMEDENKQIYYFEYEYDSENDEVPYHRKIIFLFSTESYIVLGSFNGLICIYGSRPSIPDVPGPACICNPITKEYVILPEHEGCRRHLACGFGYLNSTNEYKVVRIFSQKSKFSEVEVYTVGSGNGWRNVGKFDFTFSTSYDEAGVFVNGVLYWRDFCTLDKIVVFDLVDEKFHEHLVPPRSLPVGGYDNDTLVIGVSDGILFCAVNQIAGEDVYSDVWLLNKKNDNHGRKEPGEHLSLGWGKEFTLSYGVPFTFTRNGYALFYDQGYLKYDPEDSISERFADFSEISCQVFPHRHTLVSLKELGEEDTKIMNTREIEETDGSGASEETNGSEASD